MRHVTRKAIMRAVVILAIFLLGFGASKLSVPQKSPQITHEAASFESASVSRVIDGDTIVLTDGRRVRYIGMDAPETVDPKKTGRLFRPPGERGKQTVN